MDQALSLYLLETIPLLDPESETHALDLLTLVESILENPELILRRQLDKLKGEAVAKMKAEGLDYDQRMEQLEKLEYPKPLRDFVYATFNAFADRHPWVGEENIRPKSIAREMFEGFRSFSDYVQEYDLERAEGLLLRHLNSVYKVLGQTVPDGVKTDTVREMELYLRDMLRGVDSSLLDEWERMRDPDYRPLGTGGADLRPPRPEEPPDVTRDAKAFTAAIRTRVFAFLRAWSIGDDEAALGTIDAPGDADGEPWTVERLRAAREAHRVEHARPPPRPRGPQPPPHPRRALRRPRHLARAADARGPGGPQRLGAGARGGPRRLARAGRAGAAAPAPRQPGVGLCVRASVAAGCVRRAGRAATSTPGRGCARHGGHRRRAAARGVRIRRCGPLGHRRSRIGGDRPGWVTTPPLAPPTDRIPPASGSPYSVIGRIAPSLSGRSRARPDTRCAPGTSGECSSAGGLHRSRTDADGGTRDGPALRTGVPTRRRSGIGFRHARARLGGRPRGCGARRERCRPSNGRWRGLRTEAKRRASSRSSFSVTAASMSAPRSPSGTRPRMRARSRFELLVKPAALAVNCTLYRPGLSGRTMAGWHRSASDDRRPVLKHRGDSRTRAGSPVPATPTLPSHPFRTELTT